MATKSKSTATSTLPKALGDKLSKAISLVEAKKHGEAESMLHELAKEAAEGRHLGLERTVRTYLTVCAVAKPVKGPAPSPEMQAQLHLNRRESKEALEILDKALKAHSDWAQLHYLKAIAFAQLGDVASTAAALGKAVELNNDTRFVYRLESDFDAFRREPAFVTFET